MNILFLIACVISDGTSFPLQYRVAFDSTNVMQGDIVYCEARVTNVSQKEADAFSPYPYDSVMIEIWDRDTFRGYPYSPEGAGFGCDGLFPSKLAPGRSESQPLLIAPWYIVRPTPETHQSSENQAVVTRMRTSLDFLVLGNPPHESPHSILSDFPKSIAISATFRFPNGPTDGLRRTGVTLLMVEGEAIAENLIQDWYIDWSSAKRDYEQRSAASIAHIAPYPIPHPKRRLGAAEWITRFARISPSFFGVPFKLERDRPENVSEFLKLTHPSSRLYRVLKLTEMANEWVMLDGEARTQFESKILSFASIGGPAESAFLCERVKYLFETKLFESNPPASSNTAK